VGKCLFAHQSMARHGMVGNDKPVTHPT